MVVFSVDSYVTMPESVLMKMMMSFDPLNEPDGC